MFFINIKDDNNHIVYELIDKDFIESRVQDSWEAFEELKKLTEKYTPEYYWGKTSTVTVGANIGF